MQLKFLGNGSCFNTQMGNTSGYMIDNENDMYLFDCGADVFSKIKNNNILDGVNNVYVFITHFHDDHMGSLASLIFYSYYILKKKVTIIHPKLNILRLLSFQGCHRICDYMIFSSKYINERYEYMFHSTKHDENIDSFSIDFFDTKTKKGIFYSGDTKEYMCNNNTLKKKIIENDYVVYQDVSSIDDRVTGVHMSLEKLDSIVDTDRSKIYCMHMESFEMIDAIKEAGFSITETI